MRINVQLVSINVDKPITAQGVCDYVTYLKEMEVQEATICLVKRKSLNATDYKDLRNVFD